MKEKFRRFMSGRYGADLFNRFLSITVIVLCVLMTVFRNVRILSTVLWLLTWVLLFYSLFRMFSRNYDKRSEENRAYLRIRDKVISKLSLIRQKFRDRKKYKYFICPQCGKNLRVPKGAGKILITCPNCANKFEGKA